MEIRHLKALIAVAEEMHFGRAAARLHLSPPPVSLAIKELEAELGLKLFERTSRRISLTVGGQEVLRDARSIVARTESMRTHAHAAASGLSGSVSVGFISPAAYSFLPDVLRRFSIDFPEVHLSLHEASTDRIFDDLESGGQDIGFMFASSDKHATLTYHPTNRYELVLALPETHALARMTRVPLRRLSGERFLLFERHQGTLMFDSVVAMCMHHGFSPRIFHARQQHTIVSLVSAGFGVALVPDCVQVMRREGVVYRRLQGEHPTVETGVAWRTDDESPTVQALLQYVPQLKR